MMMKKKLIVLVVGILFSFTYLRADAQKIHGLVYDIANGQPLQFAQVSVVNHSLATISNEQGHFQIDLSSITDTDTIEVFFLGYAPYKLLKKNISSPLSIGLKATIQELATVIVTPNTLSAEDILKQALLNRRKNHRLSHNHQQVFHRSSSTNKISDFDIINKKFESDFFTPSMTQKLIDSMPRNIIQYTDWLVDIYSDSLNFKNIPIKGVAIDESGLNEVFEKIFGNLEEYINLKNKDKNTFWKVKSGFLFGSKLQPLDTEDSTSIDKSSTPKDEDSTSHHRINQMAKNTTTSIYAEKEKFFWGRLFKKPHKYDLVLEGIRDIAGERAYEISFAGKKKEAAGKVYISTDTYAMLYQTVYTPDDFKGDGFNLLGFSYQVKGIEGNIRYRKVGDQYQLQYLHDKQQIHVGVKRPISLLQKQKRFFINKTIQNIKVKLKINIESILSEEYLVISSHDIEQKTFDEQSFDPNFKIEYIQQYDPEIWEEYTIIAPSELMKEYRK